MEKDHIHIETITAQIPKHAGAVCGDVIECDRDEHATLLCLCDGVGSGIRANIAATVCAARLRTLLREGFSLRQAVTEVAGTMEQAKQEAATYCAFTVARILNDGSMTALSYESPPPLLYCGQHAHVLPARSLSPGKTMLTETHCRLQDGDALLMVSDGITQAGIGTRFHQAWGIEGVARFLAGHTITNDRTEGLPDLVLREATRLGDGGTTDDMSALLARCRLGSTLAILTGPPVDPRRDPIVIKRFMDMNGKKVICGGTTAKIVAALLNKPILSDPTIGSLIAPPGHRLEGIDLLTEGALTLNQTYNILDVDPANYDEDNSVTRLCRLMREADRILIIAGGSLNPASNHISFKQQGVLPRATIVPMLADKLRARGKHVTIEFT